MATQLIQAAQQALEALHEAVAFREGGRQKAIDAINALRTAIQQAEGEPVAEPCARVELIKTGGNAGLSTRIIELDIATRERLRPGDLLYTHPAPGVPEFSRIAKRKLDELQEQGFAITGYAIQRGTKRGFITDGGFVGWWRSDEAPSVFLVRDVASLLRASVPDVCNALAELGYEPRRSTNAAISPDEAIAVAKRVNPAPGVPDDVVRDAERYRWLRDRDHWPAPFASSQDPEPVRGIDLDAAIDAAILAASQVQEVDERDGWTDADADAARLALELECLLLDTKDTAAVSRWWASANEALDLHRARLAASQAQNRGLR